MMTPPPTSETRAARYARRLLERAEIAKSYRQRLRSLGRPTARRADQALVEATSFLIRFVRSAPVTVNVADLHTTATTILIREGYDRKSAKRVLSDRLRPRDAHTSTSRMPSVSPGVDKLIEPPKRGQVWLQSDLDGMREVIARSSHVVTAD